jgi:hypothetical protein
MDYLPLRRGPAAQARLDAALLAASRVLGCAVHDAAAVPREGQRRRLAVCGPLEPGSPLLILAAGKSAGVLAEELEGLLADGGSALRSRWAACAGPEAALGPWSS